MCSLLLIHRLFSTEWHRLGHCTTFPCLHNTHYNSMVCLWMLIHPRCAASSWSTEWYCMACCSFFPHTQYTLGFRDGGCVNFERSHMCAFILINTLLSTRWHCIACCNIFPHTQYTLGFWDCECANIDRSQLSSFLSIHILLSTHWLLQHLPVHIVYTYLSGV